MSADRHIYTMPHQSNVQKCVGDMVLLLEIWLPLPKHLNWIWQQMHSSWLTSSPDTQFKPQWIWPSHHLIHPVQTYRAPTHHFFLVDHGKCRCRHNIFLISSLFLVISPFFQCLCGRVYLLLWWFLFTEPILFSSILFFHTSVSRPRSRSTCRGIKTVTKKSIWTTYLDLISGTNASR